MHNLQIVGVFFLTNSLTCLSHLLTLASEDMFGQTIWIAFCPNITIVCILSELDGTIGCVIHPTLGT